MPVVDSPLVTFLLLTYGQERFVADAIKGAFSQTYGPLEIIISDDCSTDQTIDCINNVVSEYHGQHSVHVTQTPKNMGTFANVMHGVKAAKGELVVLAAGDDISVPERVGKLVAAWQKTHAWGLHSRLDCIDEEGVLLSESQLVKGLLQPRQNAGQGRYFCADDGPVHKVHGAGSAYDAKLFEYLKRFSEEYTTSEDGVFSFALNLLGKKIHFVNESLVHYREHSDATCNKGKNINASTMEDIVVNEQKHKLRMKSYANNNKVYLELSDSLGDLKLRQVNKKEIAYEIKRHTQKAYWTESNFIDRVKFMLTFRNAKDFKWMFPRILGEKPFYLLKYFVHVKLRH